jgi:cobalamin biosynthesis protein CobT
VPHNLQSIYTAANTRIDSCTSSADTLAVAQWIVQQIQQQDDTPQDTPQPDGKPDQQGDDQGDEQDGTPGQGQGDDQGDDQGDQQGQDGQQGDEQGDGKGDGKGKGDKGDQQAPDAGKSQPIKGKHAQPVEVEPGIKHQNGKGNRGTFTRDQQVLRDQAHIRSSNRITFSPAPVSARLTMDIRKLFENTGSDDWQMRRKTGCIDTRALATGGVNMFKRRLETSGVDSSVVILLDVSASMFGMPGHSLIEHAAPACIALMAALDAAGVESALVSFGSETSTIKPFSKNSRRTGALLNRLGDGGGTNDYAGLLYAHSLLHTRQTARKVVFVLTDGEGDSANTKAQALAGENLGIVTIGIGIQHDVRHVFKHAVRVNNAANLGTAMFSKIKGVL